MQFVIGDWKAKAWGKFYNKQNYEWSDNNITFEDALQEKFNYEELMNEL